MERERVRGVVIKDNKILLMFRNKYGDTYFSIPGGGKKESDKSLQDAVKREILEETSISVGPEFLIDKFEKKDSNEIQYLYLCKYISGEPTLGDSPEKDKMLNGGKNVYLPVWVNFECLESMLIQPKQFRKALLDYVASINSSSDH